MRKYDDDIGRFTSIDPMWEKYYAMTPYHYSANNPVSFLDPGGMDFYLTGGSVNEAISICEDASGGFYTYTADDDGNIEMESTGKKGTPTPEQQAFIDLMLDLTDPSKGDVKIATGEDLKDVLVGDYNKKTIDVGDLKKIGFSSDLTNTYSAIAHEFKEQSLKQRSGKWDIANHHKAANNLEATITNSGYVRLPIDDITGIDPKTGTGVLIFHYTNGKKIRTLKLYIVNANIKKIVE